MTPPVPSDRSVSSRMRSLYFAVKLRRFGVLVSSAGGATGAETTRAGVWEAVTSGIILSDAAFGETGICEGMTICSFSYTLKCKLQPLNCLTLIGTEGSGYQGNLGFAYPTSLGAKVGCPDKPVVAILGDGGFMFAASELSTAAQHGIGVVAIVFNNRAYGNVARDQIINFAGRTIASDLPGVDYVKLAEANGVKGYRVGSPAELEPVLERAIAEDVPALIEVQVDLEEETNPWPLILRSDVPYSC